jgi:adenylate kinase
MEAAGWPHGHRRVVVRHHPSQSSAHRGRRSKTRLDVAVVLIGLPGAGKGTQAQLLADQGWSHVNAGGLARSEVAARTEWGKRAAAIMQRGDLLPSQDIQGLIARALRHSRPPVVIEGYPRRLSEASSLPVLCGAETTLVPIFLDIPLAASADRVAQRVICDRCGRVAREGRESVCSKCSGPLAGRADDKSQKAMARRLQNFERETVPLIEYYRSRGELETVDALQDEASVNREIIMEISARCR